MLKTILMAVMGFGLLWLALVAELAAGECIESIHAWGGVEGTGPPTSNAPVCTPEGDWAVPRETAPRPAVASYCGGPGQRSLLETVERMIPDETYAGLMYDICRRDPCHQGVRHYYGLAPCGPLDKALARGAGG